MNNKFYDGNRLLSKKDINGQTPEIFISSGVRSAGKSTFFNKWTVNQFIDKGNKFALLYRHKYETKGCSEKFFSDINGLFFPNYEMHDKTFFDNMFTRLYLNDDVCGYALALNNADNIKKFSHLFNDVSVILFDEFQPESNQYLTDEIEKFQSIHVSLARGKGQQVRYLPVIMISNFVTLLNPYYHAMGIDKRLKNETKFLRGDGFVLEQSSNEAAANAQKQSAFNRALGQTQYLKYASEISYLNDNLSFIEKPSGRGRYFATITTKNKMYGIIKFDEFVYVTDKADADFPIKISLTVDDHNTGFVLSDQYAGFIMSLRNYFQMGLFRFKNLECKEIMLNMLHY